MARTTKDPVKKWRNDVKRTRYLLFRDRIVIKSLTETVGDRGVTEDEKETP